VSLIGPSGCGQEHTAQGVGRLIPRARQRYRRGTRAAGTAKNRNDWSRISDATLLPWKSAIENAAFLLQTADKSISRKQATERAATMLGWLDLSARNAKRPSQLSGGMRQRVAIARALALVRKCC